MRARRLAVFLVPLLATLVPVAPGADADGDVVVTTRALVFSGEGNRLNVYDGSTGEKQRLIPSVADDPASGRDINAQICFTEIDGTTYFIAGEDSGQGDEGGSPGWGWFRLTGDEVGSLSWEQLGKLRPTWSPLGETEAENYGCGFLDDGRLVTSDVGKQFPHEEASGQLIVWFPNDDGGFADATASNPDPPAGEPDWKRVDNSDDSAYCKIDTSIGTAGGVAIHRDADENEWVYVASNRPGPNGPGGIYRYRASDFPDDAGCAGHGNQVDLVDDGVVERQLWLPSDAFVLTPSALVPSGRTWNGFPTWYVSSVFTGVIAEYADTGAARVHVRNVVEPPAGAPIGQLDDLPPNDGGTPFGMGVTSARTLWYADLGIQGPGPNPGHGSVQRVTFDSHGATQRLVVDDGLTFPDGIGILEVTVETDTPGGPPPTATKGDSESECGWSMYGRSASRTFSLPDDCASAIGSTSVQTLAPKWIVKTEKTVTASPVVSHGKVFVGDWSGTMYAVDAQTGEVDWTFDTEDAPGATFGPIVSSAAVAEVHRKTHQTGQPDRRDLVVFGAGPRLYALHVEDGAAGTTVDDQGDVAWTHVLDLDPDTPVEIESSPVVERGVVYVGFDNHNTPGTGVPGGLLALDAFDGSELWRFEPELGEDEGCGGVWSSPAIFDPDDFDGLDLGDADELVYLATANCPSDDFEWTPHTEAVTALNAHTGEVVWSFQPHVANRKDWDFGATPNVFRSGDDVIVGIGNKDGVYYALDALTGELRWSTQVAEPGDVRDDFSIGGFIGSTAVHEGRVFGGTALGGPAYYHALDAGSGAFEWRGAQAPSYAASAAVNDVVFAGALDNVLRAYHADTGAVLWAAPLLGPISSGPAIVGDSVYVGSGTSSSDACPKSAEPFSTACFTVFDDALGSTGGIHAFELGV